MAVKACVTRNWLQMVPDVSKFLKHFYKDPFVKKGSVHLDNDDFSVVILGWLIREVDIGLLGNAE